PDDHALEGDQVRRDGAEHRGVAGDPAVQGWQVPHDLSVRCGVRAGDLERGEVGAWLSWAGPLPLTSGRLPITPGPLPLPPQLSALVRFAAQARNGRGSACCCPCCWRCGERYR